MGSLNSGVASAGATGQFCGDLRCVVLAAARLARGTPSVDGWGAGWGVAGVADVITGPAVEKEGPGGRDDVFLRFDAVRSAFHVWVNGHAVGYAQDSFTPKVTLFSLLFFCRSCALTTAHAGIQHRQVCAAHRQCSVRTGLPLVRWLVSRRSGEHHTRCEATPVSALLTSLLSVAVQDFWDLSGIVRSVCVHRVPPVHLRDVTIRTDFTNPRYCTSGLTQHSSHSLHSSSLVYSLMVMLHVSTNHRQSCTEGLLAASLRVAAGPAAPAPG